MNMVSVITYTLHFYIPFTVLSHFTIVHYKHVNIDVVWVIQKLVDVVYSAFYI